MASDEEKPEAADSSDKTRKPGDPQTPHRTPAAKRKSPNGTNGRKASAPAGLATPKSAPAANGRTRAVTAKGPPPTLLHDFLVGRPSSARVAADRQAARKRQMSLEQVKQEMREQTLRKVQAPGNVRDRVMKWQKNNAAPMAGADPLAAPSEPSECNIQVDAESVTEEDRTRIKKGLKKASRPVVVVQREGSSDDAEKENQEEDRTASPPKKRVVSDTNWVKNKRKSPQRGRSPKEKRNESTGSPLPSDFLAKTAQNPTVKHKIKDWASRVELPDDPRMKQYHGARSKSSGDGMRVSAMRSEGGVEDGEGSEIIVGNNGRIRTKPTDDDDGIRVAPLRKRSPKSGGERVRSQKLQLPNDGIRVYTSEPTSRNASTVRASSRRESPGPSTVAASTQLDASPSDRIEVFEESESEVPETPTRRGSGKRTDKTRRKPATRSRADTGTTLTEDVSDTASWTSESDGSDKDSDLPSSIPSKLADIPVGYSAFSELDLPVRGQPQRPKAARNTSFKGATNALKKALTEGKKIIAEKVDPPPKPVASQPRSIESWLNKTVDPFVDDASVTREAGPQRTSVEKERTEVPKRKSADSTPIQGQSTDSKAAEPSEKPADKDDPSNEPDEETTPTQAGLRRSRATRSASSPLKVTPKKTLREKIKEAFRGESGFLNPAQSTGSSQDTESSDISVEHPQARRRSDGSASNSSSHDEKSPKSQDPIADDESTPYPKRRPPTNGFHELSTILSLGSSTTGESDLSSMLSESTVTQTTSVTKSTSTGLTRHRNNKHGLKRRLTKHSDLVSVLSLADDNAKPSRSSSRRSGHSIRRPSSRLETATVEDLLQEFADDEDLYQRELKTLVDGVIPVLLSQVVHNKDGSGIKEDLFSPSASKGKEGSLSKAVVNMGIALEKLKREHKRCPLGDAQRLPQWLHSMLPIYEGYLDVWRLGYQGVIVNLAPLDIDDNDSLVNAMPRNAAGDVLNEDGKRVDVAHLLKRPLVRIKWINKFTNAYQTVTGTEKHHDLVRAWDKLQEKARRRHKEEIARAVDDDATNTDTNRVRDLKTLEALDNVKVDRYRQVFAKDFFSLDLQHSNGQRLECQVELIFRDNQLFKSDPGDLLIREAGEHGRSWLLFAPVVGSQCSARRGDEPGQLVVMIRGPKDEWFQLLTLRTDNEQQALEWLDIFGTSPVPHAVSKAEALRLPSEDKQAAAVPGDIPLGEKRRRQESGTQATANAGASPEQPRGTTPARYGSRTAASPLAHSSWNEPASPERTSTSNGHAMREVAVSPTWDEGRSRPLREDLRPDPLDLTKSAPQREDGAPPPPAHRTLPKKSPTTAAPVELTPSKVKRRTSSPLKHEYHPSDGSDDSTSVSSSDGEESGAESSDDELEAADIPDSMPAISIKKSHTEAQSGSAVSESTVSLTPSASASQAGLPKFGADKPEYLSSSVASISYWDNKKGSWNDLWPDLCTLVTTPGLIEAYPLRRTRTTSDTVPQEEQERPLIAMDLTPLVMLRNSTAVDLEIRSPVLSYARLYAKVMKIETSFFRFRSASYNECEALYMAVHRARMDNAKYKALEEEARVRAFGQNQLQGETEDGGSSSQQRSWFGGRRNSYRVSARAPSQSASASQSHASSSASASSFIRRLIQGGNQSFNIAMSSVDKQSSRAGSGGGASLYGSSSSGTPPRSPSVSAANSGGAAGRSLGSRNLKIRLHLLVSASRWEDHGNCLLEVMRPDQGTRQKLRTYQGMEKRVVVTSMPRKESEKPAVILDVVLGSRCFARLGSRGIVLNVWEEVKDESGEAGVAPKDGASGGVVKKWCFQCARVPEAAWIYGLVTQEVHLA